MNDPAPAPGRRDAEGADWLTPPERLAIAYAPRRVRAAWIGFLALDSRLAEAARPGREPIMIQLRLAWWRDRFAQPAAQWPRGEPLLDLLSAWDGERAALAGMVNGWEARVVGEDGGVALTEARIGAIEALARLGGASVDAALRVAAQQWIDPAAAAGLAVPRLPRAMRPLSLLGYFNRLADDEAPLRTVFTVLRIGLLGR